MEQVNLTTINLNDFQNANVTASVEYGSTSYVFFNNIKFQVISIMHGTSQTFINLLDFFVPMTILSSRKCQDAVIDFGNMQFHKHKSVLNLVHAKKEILQLHNCDLEKLILFGSHSIFTAITRKYTFNCDLSGGRDLLTKTITILKDIPPKEDFSSELFIQIASDFKILRETEYTDPLLNCWRKHRSWCYEVDIIPLIICATITYHIQDRNQKLLKTKILEIKKQYGFRAEISQL